MMNIIRGPFAMLLREKKPVCNVIMICRIESVKIFGECKIFCETVNNFV